MFIIHKKFKTRRGDRKLYYLVRNYREGKKIKRCTILPLGESSNLLEALQSICEQKESVLHRLLKLENDLNRAEKRDWSVFNSFSPPHKQLERMREYYSQTKLELEKISNNELILEKLTNRLPKP